MTARQPNPRDLKRLQSLEADLKAQRDASETLARERSELDERIKALEAQLKAAQQEIDQQAKASAGLTRQLERQFKARGIDAPADASLPAFFESFAAWADGTVARAETAEKNGAALEKQLATAAEAITAADQKFRELKAKADTREAEFKALTGELAEANKTIKDLQQDGSPIEPLLAENQRLATQIDATAAELKALQEVAKAAKADTAAARSETEAKVRAELAPEIKRLTSQQAALQKQLDTANVQLKTEGKTPLLPADKVVSLLNDLVDRFQAGIGGLQIRDGELALKVGFGAAGETGGFVIPTTDSPPELRENLQQITLRFDRSSPPQE